MPKADIDRLFDHLVGAREQRGRDLQAERLCGLEVDHKFILGRCLNRQIRGFLALKDAIDVACRASESVDRIRSVGHQAAVSYEVARQVDGWQFVPGCKPYDQIALEVCQRAPGDNQAAARAAPECRNRTLDLTGIIALIDRGQFNTER